MVNIKRNEEIGRTIEELVASEIPGSTIPYQGIRGPYDVETQDSIIEVKSCRVKTKNAKRKDQQYMQEGRFSILVHAHENLGVLSKERGKRAEYVFIVYEMMKESGNYPLLVDRATLSWKEVDDLIKDRPPYTRNDGELLVTLTHSRVFTIEGGRMLERVE